MRRRTLSCVAASSASCCWITATTSYHMTDSGRQQASAASCPQMVSAAQASLGKQPPRTETRIGRLQRAASQPNQVTLVRTGSPVGLRRQRCAEPPNLCLREREALPSVCNSLRCSQFSVDGCWSFCASLRLQNCPTVGCPRKCPARLLGALQPFKFQYSKSSMVVCIDSPCRN